MRQVKILREPEKVTRFYDNGLETVEFDTPAAHYHFVYYDSAKIGEGDSEEHALWDAAQKLLALFNAIVKSDSDYWELKGE